MWTNCSTSTRHGRMQPRRRITRTKPHSTLFLFGEICVKTKDYIRLVILLPFSSLWHFSQYVATQERPLPRYSWASSVYFSCSRILACMHLYDRQVWWHGPFVAFAPLEVSTRGTSWSSLRRWRCRMSSTHQVDLNLVVSISMEVNFGKHPSFR